ncbi:MAG TPA: lytic transglycosylase domain-containing protein [Clostridia bacterium]|nr:lytic transglycosylase domain-containing protein [Clostridia bacterium]
MGRKILLWLILFIIAGMSLYWFSQSSYMKRRTYPLEYKEDIVRYSKEYDLDPHLIMGMVWVESKFNPEATSPKNAKGLMQIIPSTGQWIAEQLGQDDYEEGLLYDPETNIKFGTWYFAYLLRVFDGNIEVAIASYNGGMGNVMKWLKDPRYSDDGEHLKDIPFNETRNYLERVLETREWYKRLYEI